VLMSFTGPANLFAQFLSRRHGLGIFTGPIMKGITIWLRQAQARGALDC
jgi:hypothetical protein